MDRNKMENTEVQSHPQFVITEENNEANTKKVNELVQKVKKKKKMLVVSLSILIATVFVSLYSFTTFSKIEKMNDLNSEKKVLEAKSNDVTVIINHHSTLLSLGSYAECYQTTSGLKGGSAFEVDYTNHYLPVHENKKKDIEALARACTPRGATLHIEGANDLVQSINKELEEANTKNESYVAEAKGVASDWKTFIEESEKIGSGVIESEVYNRLRTLAAKAIGVSPTMIGDSMNFAELHAKVKNRLQVIDDKQTKISADKVNQFVETHADGKTKEVLQAEVKDKKLEVEQLRNEISDLDSQIRTRKSDLLNPFK